MNDNKGGMDDLMWVCIIIAVLLLVANMYYDAHRAEFNTYLLAINKYQLQFFALFGASDASLVLKKLEWGNPGKYDLNQVIALFRLTGTYTRYPVIAVLLGLLWHSYYRHGVSENYRRVFSMKSLMINNVHEFPCMAPVANRDLLDEPLDSGPWKVARTPLQWVAENNLLLDEHKKPVDKSLIIDSSTGLANIKSPLLSPKKISYFLWIRKNQNGC
nr:hypothetical protein [Methylomarinum sp. Ch1-1]MDP4523156.1 hypothetical protein [Methylomarinum sp. Ch1-1]